MTNYRFEKGVYVFGCQQNIYTERVNIFFLDALLIVAQGIEGNKNVRFFPEKLWWLSTYNQQFKLNEEMGYEL